MAVYFMDWEKEIGKCYFFKIQSRNGQAYYTGIIKNVAQEFNSRIEIIDKFGNNVGFTDSEIVKYKQESIEKFQEQMKNNSYSKPKNTVVPQGSTACNKSY